MRALPLIERVLLTCLAVMIVALLVFLVAWHLRWNAMQRTIAANIPRPGLVLAGPGPEDPQVLCDFCAWGERMSAPVLWRQNEISHPWVDASLGQLDALLARGLHVGGGARGIGGFAGLWQAMEGMDTAAWCWEQRARQDGDASAAVAADGAMIAALTPCRCVHALSVWVKIAAHRDETCLSLALQGRLSAAVLQRWRDAPGVDLDQLQLALEGERRWWYPQEASQRFGMNVLDYWQTYLWTVPWSNGAAAFAQWWHEPDQLAVDLQQLSMSQDAIARRDPQVAWDGHLERIERADEIVVRQMLKHRFAVLAAQVLAIRDRSGAFPLKAPPELDLSGGSDRQSLQYTGDAAGFTIAMPAYTRPESWMEWWLTMHPQGKPDDFEMYPLSLNDFRVTYEHFERGVGGGP